MSTISIDPESRPGRGVRAAARPGSGIAADDGIIPERKPFGPARR